jgi:protein involved in polysaccharide export with SLBB domain
VRFALVLLLLAALLPFGGAEVLLRPGDRLQIASQEPLANVRREVSPHGFLSLPRVGAVMVAGLGLFDAARAVEERMRRAFPGISVQLTLLAQPNSPVQVAGAVRHPGSIPFRADLRLADALQRAEPLPEADLTRVTVVDAQGGSLVFDWLGPVEGMTVRNPELRPGDRIVFPRRTRALEVYVVGAVARPGSLDFVAGMTVRRAVALAGGALAHADLQSVSVSRQGRALERVDLRAGDAVLEVGDVVQVPLAAQREFASVSGAVRQPGRIPLAEGMRLSQVLEAAGGLDPGAALVRIEWKSLGTGRTRVVDLLAIRAGRAEDPVVRANDAIHVPSLRPGGGSP